MLTLPDCRPPAHSYVECMSKNSFGFSSRIARRTFRAAALSALLVTVASETASSQSPSDGFGIYGGFGPAHRDLRDYTIEDPNPSGTAGSLSLEIPSGRQSTYVFAASVARFRPHFIIPTPINRIGPTAQLTRIGSPSAFEPDWSPDGNGANDLSVYSLTVGVKRYLIPSLGRSGLYVEGDLGGVMFQRIGQSGYRFAFDAAAGYLWQPTKHVGLYAESRYDWLGAAFAGEAKSPRWIAMPIAAGVSFRR